MAYNKKYVPKTLTEKDKQTQKKSIREKTERPKLESFKTKRSPFVERFEKKYGFKITDKSKIAKSLMTLTGINKVLGHLLVWLLFYCLEKPLMLTEMNCLNMAKVKSKKKP